MLEHPAITTFLFTDIEGSNSLWEREPVRMRAALARHDAIARGAVENHRGEVVKTSGDGIDAVFGIRSMPSAPSLELKGSAC